MYIAKVIGTIVSTKKDPHLVGTKLLIIIPFNGKDYREDRIEVAVDSVGAGIGEEVLVVKGNPAQKIPGAEDAPLDLAIVGIIDQMEISNR